MSSTIRLKVIVEGQTEEKFVKEILAPSMYAKMIFPTPLNLEGVSKYSIIKKNVAIALGDKSAYVTTMLDFYGLPKSFPGQDSLPGTAIPSQKVKLLEDAFENDIGSRRFIPYIQLHEFETLLFSDINAIDEVLSVLNKSELNKLRKITDGKTPEEINDQYESAPSRRLLKLYPGYQKASDGVRIIQRIIE